MATSLDIVERLRLAPSADFYRPSKWFELMVEAADEIERLRAQLARYEPLRMDTLRASGEK